MCSLRKVPAKGYDKLMTSYEVKEQLLAEARDGTIPRILIVKTRRVTLATAASGSVTQYEVENLTEFGQAPAPAAV